MVWRINKEQKFAVSVAWSAEMHKPTDNMIMIMFNYLALFWKWEFAELESGLVVCCVTQCFYFIEYQQKVDTVAVTMITIGITRNMMTTRNVLRFTLLLTFPWRVPPVGKAVAKSLALHSWMVRQSHWVSSLTLLRVKWAQQSLSRFQTLTMNGRILSRVETRSRCQVSLWRSREWLTQICTWCWQSTKEEWELRSR